MLVDPCPPPPPSPPPAVQHLQTISNLSENQASEEEDELGELRELGYPQEDDEEDEDEEEDEEEDSQAEVLKGSRGTGKLKGLWSVVPATVGQVWWLFQKDPAMSFCGQLLRPGTPQSWLTCRLIRFSPPFIPF
jgi:hypothetical protein